MTSERGLSLSEFLANKQEIKYYKIELLLTKSYIT